jgi:hypothetical protein
MTTLNKIHPTPNIHDEYGIIVDSTINMYDDYGILTSDDENEIIKDEIRPSVLVKNSKSKNIKTYSDTNSDTNSDTDSDGYNENNIINNFRRRPSFIKKSLRTLSTRIEASPDHIKDTLIDTNNTNNQNSYFGIFKRKTILGLSLISGTILSLIFIL